MAKKKYAIQWENDEAVAFEINGIVYKKLEDIPDQKDLVKIMSMMTAADMEVEPETYTGLSPEKIILGIFTGVAVLMLLITAISVFFSLRKINNEISAPGVIVDMVVQREYSEEDRDRVVGEAYFPVVRFTASDGRRRDVHLAEGSYPPSYEIGDEVTVRYNPDRPLEARIDSFGSNVGMWILPTITGILGLGFGGAVLAVQKVLLN